MSIPLHLRVYCDMAFCYSAGLTDNSDVQVSSDCGDSFFSKARVSATVERTDQVAISDNGNLMMMFKNSRYQVATWIYYESFFRVPATVMSTRYEIALSDDGRFCNFNNI